MVCCRHSAASFSLPTLLPVQKERNISFQKLTSSPFASGSRGWSTVIGNSAEA